METAGILFASFSFLPPFYPPFVALPAIPLPYQFGIVGFEPISHQPHDSTLELSTSTIPLYFEITFNTLNNHIGEGGLADSHCESHTAPKHPTERAEQQPQQKSRATAALEEQSNSSERWRSRNNITARHPSPSFFFFFFFFTMALFLFIFTMILFTADPFYYTIPKNGGLEPTSIMWQYSWNLIPLTVPFYTGIRFHILNNHISEGWSSGRKNES
jgi:hypothetical protein